MKITREIADIFIATRLLFIASARTRDDLRIIACSGRCDIDLIWEMGLITTAEKIQRECELSQAVQKRLADMMPVRLAMVPRNPLQTVSDEQLAAMVKGEMHG
tara:strand:+ start:14336 stop:14644 length:309 start_codon:yes stop_codon:yes gene_type:complete